MTLRDVALLNMRRRKAKAAFVLTGLMIGVATVVALITLFQSVSHNILHKMEKYGANILVVPKSQNLSLSYGGISLGGVSLETREIHESDVDRIATIPTAQNVAAVGPMVLGAVAVEGREVMLARGRLPGVPHLEALVGDRRGQLAGGYSGGGRHRCRSARRPAGSPARGRR